MGLEILDRPLTRDQIDFKIAQIIKTEDSVWGHILAYKDARVDMTVLDEAVGKMNWQVKYERDSKGVLQCSVGIWDETKNMGSGDWVWKSSNGVESDFESEKGEYSDAFKRACFMWGIGKKLYDFPTIRVQLIEGDYFIKDGKAFASRKLRPNDWSWDISEDYKSVSVRRKLNGKLAEVYNSNPYKK